jgi:DNA primase
VSRKIVEIAGRRVSLSNLKKDLFPPYGFTKADIMEYYLRIAKFIPKGPEGISFSRSVVPLTVRPG